MTQGYTREEAHERSKDLIETMAGKPEVEVTVCPLSGDEIEIGANDVRVQVALLLRRQREKQGITLAEAAGRLQQKSRNAYARYEQGQAVPTIEKLEELLQAIVPEQKLIWRLAS